MTMFKFKFATWPRAKTRPGRTRDRVTSTFPGRVEPARGLRAWTVPRVVGVGWCSLGQ